MLKSKINISIIYAFPEKQYIRYFKMPYNSNVEQAIIKSNFLVKFKELQLPKIQVGIFNKLTSLNSILKNGDRIEIYRKLKCNPKKMRNKCI